MSNNNNSSGGGDEDGDEVVHFSSTPEPSIANAFAVTNAGNDTGGYDDDQVHDIRAHDHRETDSPQSDYEIVQSAQDFVIDGDDDDNVDDEDALDGEMDELEAEIAQALGD